MRALCFFSALVLVVVAGCDSSSPATCSPAGFTACSGNTLVNCVSATDGGGSGGPGMQVRVDCTAMGQVCIESTGSAACSAPVLSELCFTRDMQACGASDQLLRCVWVSEQPQPGVTGDVGVWRVQTDCTTSSQVCRLQTAACAAP